MKFEEVILALRMGNPVRRTGWAKLGRYIIYEIDTGRLVEQNGKDVSLNNAQLLSCDDWEIVTETKRVDDYLIPSSWSTTTDDVIEVWYRKRYDNGLYPEGAILIPNTARGVPK
jgi:hypothetical protein